jgi:hypothetical protein
MKKSLTLLLFTSLSFIGLISCLKQPEAIEDLKKSCLYDDKTDYFKKWANAFTVIQTTNNDGKVIVEKTIYPIGYFWLNNDGSYKVLSNGDPRGGAWDVTDSCKLVLDPKTAIERNFDVLQLTADSLTLRRKDGNTIFVQHYAKFNCFDLSKMVKRWDNTTTEIQYYNDSEVYYTEYIYPNGYFTLLTNTYERLSNGDYLSGSWSVDSECRLVLDKGKSLERSFQIQKLTSDSLIIWRKDTVAHANYLQKYVRHQ